MARQRDYRAEYARRMARAERLGIDREKARGHRGPANLRRAIRNPNVFEVVPLPGKSTGQGDDKRFTTVRVLVIDNEGETRTYEAPIEQGPDIADWLDDADVPYEPTYLGGEQ